MNAIAHVTPTQRLVVQITGFAPAVKARLTVPGHADYAEEVALGNRAAALRVGPFRAGAEVAWQVDVLDGSDDVLDMEVGTTTITAGHSPAVVVRQAVYDALEGMDGAFVLHDGLRRPAAVAEDLPFTGGNVIVEVMPPSSRKQKRTQIRSEVTCEVPMRVFVLGRNTAEGFVKSDNTCWAIQEAIDGTRNLGLPGLLGITANDFTWDWAVEEPGVVEVEGSGMPVVLQEMTLVVPVIWMGQPAA